MEVEQARQKALLKAIRTGLVQSAHDVSEGGIGVALAESVISSQGLGANVTLAGEPAWLFSETQSRFIVSVKKEHQEAFEKLVKDAELIGEVTSDSTLAVQSQEGQQWIHAQTEELESAWKGAIPCLLKSKA